MTKHKRSKKTNTYLSTGRTPKSQKKIELFSTLNIARFVKLQGKCAFDFTNVFDKLFLKIRSNSVGNQVNLLICSLKKVSFLHMGTFCEIMIPIPHMIYRRNCCRTPLGPIIFLPQHFVHVVMVLVRWNFLTFCGCSFFWSVKCSFFFSSCHQLDHYLHL